MSAELGTLLATKLNRPSVTVDLVARPRLFARLDRGFAGPLTLVCAPAGFGKTTLVSAWAAGRAAAAAAGLPAPRVAWLTLDEHDSELPVFASYLVAALRTAFPDACSGTLDLLGGPRGASPATLAEKLSNDLARLPGRAILVLDDYQSLRGSEVHALLEALLRHWPKPLHLVITARETPPIPLSRLRAQGLLTEIRSWHLRFTADETEQYLSQMLPAPQDPAAMVLLEQRMEGWIAGLRLATLSLGGAGDAARWTQALARADELVADYLVDEVLARQPPAVQDFLLVTSLLDRFCAPLCAAVADGEAPGWPAQTCLEWVRQADLFLISLDDRGHWYRYHHLFQDLLAQRAVKDLGADRSADVHRRAGEWCVHEGLVDESVRHFMAANDHDRAGQVMERALRVVLNGQDWPALTRWSHLLRDEVIQSCVGRLMIKAWALQGPWQLDAQAQLLDQVEAAMATEPGAFADADSARVWRGQLLALRGQQAYLHNQPDQAIVCCREALALLPPDWLYPRGGAMIYLALGLQMAGRADDVEHLLSGVLARDEPQDAYHLMRLLAACLSQLLAGHLERVRQLAGALLHQAQAIGAAASVGWAHHCLGVVYYQWNDLAAAREHFGWALDHYYQSTALSAGGSLMGLALTLQAGGEHLAARNMIDRLIGLEMEQQGYESDRSCGLRAWLMLMDGDLAGAARWADTFTAAPADEPLLWLEIPHLTRARILLSRGEPADVVAALHTLDVLREIAERTHNTRYRIELLALSAVGLAAQDRTDEAALTLRSAVDLARPGGFVRAFVDQGNSLRRLLAALPERRGADDQVRRVLAAYPDGHDSRAVGRPRSNHSQPEGPMPEPLTPREMEVLALLREPCSAKEIAHRLGVSHATFKRHAANLYLKLGVTSRWEAVSMAENLGLLTSR